MFFLGFAPLAVAGSPPDAAQVLHTARISLRGSDLPLSSVLNQIARSAALSVVLERDAKADTSVSPNFDNTPLATALAVVLTPLGYSYRVDATTATLRISAFDTRTFRIAVPVVQQSWESAISNEGAGSEGGGAQSGSGSAGGLGARIALKTRSDTEGLWKEVDQSLKGIIGDPANGSFSMNRVAGFVTVRTSSQLMATVSDYFDALNAEMGRTVLIETKVMQVDFRNTRQAGVDWTAVGTSLEQTGITVSGAGAVTNLPGNAAVVRFSGRAGDVLIRALEEQGELNLVAQPTLVLGNNLPAIIEVGTVQSYVAQQTQTAVQQGISQVSVQTATISDGLTLSILPRLSADGEVALALSAVLQDILDVRRENFGGGFVELPQTTRRAYSGIVRARVGESLVVGGLISNRKEGGSRGIPFLSRVPILGILFGEQSATTITSELIITITPREVTGIPTAAPAAP